MPWLVVGALILGITWWYGSRPVLYRNIQLARATELVSGLLWFHEGAILTFDRDRGPGFLQLVLNEALQADCNVELGLPELDWSAGRIEHIRRALVAKGFDVEVEQSQVGGVRQFLRSRALASREDLPHRVVDMLRLCASQLGWAESDTFTARVAGRQNLGALLERARATRASRSA